MAPSLEPKNNVTSAMQKLQHLSLINKVTKELDKNLGVNDKTLAEFIVDIAKASKFDPKTFFNELQKNGAELPEPFANELVGTIERLANKGGGGARGGEKKKVIVEKPTKENPFPGLHRPDAEEHAKMLSRELYGDRNPIENACDDPRLDKMNPGRLDENKNASSSGRGYDDSAFGQKKRKSTSEPAKRTIQGKPEVGKVYRGSVTNVMDFGAFVELVEFVNKTEGLAHVSKLPRVSNGNSARDVVQRGNPVYVKVLSLTNNRIALSMSDVNQETGEEETSYANNLPPPPPRSNPAPPRGGAAGSSIDDSSSNPIVPRFGAGAKGSNMNTVKGLSGIKQTEEDFAADGRMVDDKNGLNRRRPIKRMSSPELWEARQLIASGVLKVEDYPNFDPENDGVLAYEEEAEEEFDIEMNDEEAPFLAGQTDAALGDVSPIKIVKNPDGSMQRAAMTQGALAKERREMKETQKRAAMDEDVPENLNQAWLDPMAAQDDRKLVADVRGQNVLAEDMPEWKKQSVGKARSLVSHKKGPFSNSDNRCRFSNCVKS